MPRKHPEDAPLAVKGPNLPIWHSLRAETDDNEKKAEAKTAQDSLKEGLLGSLQMQHVVVLAGSGTRPTSRLSSFPPRPTSPKSRSSMTGGTPMASTSGARGVRN
jgi:hypothetical protein